MFELFEWYIDIKLDITTCANAHTPNKMEWLLGLIDQRHFVFLTTIIRPTQLEITI